MKSIILIVDDSPVFRAMLQHHVEQMGFEVVVCNDGFEAIRYLEKHIQQVRGVLLDIQMPQIDGISALGHFRSNYPHLPVIMITGSDDESDKRSALGLGAAGFLPKPFEEAALRALLNEWQNF